jgi:prolyl 4-hydroxylase
MMIRLSTPVLLLLLGSLVSGSASGSSVADAGIHSAQATDDLKTCTSGDGSNGECVNPDAKEANASSAATSSSGICLDDRDGCAEYAVLGHCKTNPTFMLAHCKFSCNACPENLKYFETNWGEPQESSGPNAAKIEEVIQQTEVYMNEKVYKLGMYLSVRTDCINRDKLCSKWASEGECQNNPMWMTIHCAPACQTCEKIDHRIRCPVNNKSPKAWAPGDVDYTFNRIVTDEHYQQYSPVILSRPPEASTGIVPAVHNTKLAPDDRPWVVVLENFLTEEECDRLIELGSAAGYKQSYDVGGQNFDGTYQPHQSLDRTSFNAWCQEKE